MGTGRLWIVALLAALGITLVAGCGGDDVSTTTVSAADEGTMPEEAVPDDASEIEAIEATIRTWLMHGDCELMTDRFLEEQTFNDNPKQACKTFTAGFTTPDYAEDDIEVSNIAYANDKATATVGGGGAVAITSGGEEVTSTYKLVLDDGTWRIDSAAVD